MYYDYMLKFASELAANNVLFANGNAKYDAIDVIGVIYKNTGGVVFVDGEPVASQTALSGWHVNVRHSLPAPELNSYVVTPAPVTPARVWL